MGFLDAWTSTTYLDDEDADVSDATAERLGNVLDDPTADAVADSETDSAVIFTAYSNKVDEVAVVDPDIQGLNDPDYAGVDLLQAVADTVAWGVATAAADEAAPSTTAIRSEWESNFDPEDLDDRDNLAHLDDAVVTWLDGQAWAT